MTHTKASSPARCHGCGAPVDASKQSRKLASHSCSTSFGRLRGQQQIDGRWAIAYKISTSNRSEADLDNIHQLADRLLKIKCVELARPHSFDRNAFCFYWKTPKGFFPLSNSRRKLSSKESQLIIRNISDGLRKLHQAELAAFYLAPEFIFVNPGFDKVVLIPLPWLASLALHTPDAINESVFLAPETGKSPLDEHHAKQSADIYSLGALARYLITGRQTPESSKVLPSDLRPELQEWDSFIDGCCRSYPERRFSSIDSALDALPSSASSEYQHSSSERSVIASEAAFVGHPQSQAPAEKSQPAQKTRRRAGKPIVLSLVVLSLFIIYINRNRIASIFPAAAGYIGSYQRGFGDTILSYEDRNYEGGSWEKMHDADSLLSLASAGDRYAMRPWRVAGWDDTSYWILCDEGAVFHFYNEHWSFLGRQDNLFRPIGRPVNRNCLFTYSSCNHQRPLFKIKNTTWSDCGEITGGRGYNAGSHKLCIVAPDLIYSLIENGLTKVEGREVTKLDDDKYKEAFVHRDDNTPLKRNPVDSISHTTTPKAGTAWGFSESSFSGDDLLVRFQNGFWYKVDVLKDVKPRASWLHGTPSDPDFIVFVGDDSKVWFHEINGSDLLIPITLAQEITSSDLIAVWGVDRNKFWVMDKNGTVWERTENQWRTVIRGMYREDIEFRDAWVSPTGTVIAVTKDAVYRLD
jgi:hypothetical protein